MIDHDQNLVTEAELQDLEGTIKVVSDDLSAHIAQKYQDVHQLWVQTGLSTFDNATTPPGPNQAPHKTGRNAIRVKVGNLFYLLPADPSKTGPPKLAKVTTQPITYESSAFAGEGFEVANWSCVVTGTDPFVFTWQVFNIQLTPGEFDSHVGKQGTWVDIIPGTRYGLANTLDLRSNITFAASSSTTFGSTINSAMIDAVTTGSNHGILYNYVLAIRCKVDNSAIGGGATYTAVAYLNLKDFTDSFF